MSTLTLTLVCCLLGLAPSPQRLQIDVIFEGVAMRSEIEASAMVEVASIWAGYGVNIRASSENDEGRDGAVRLVVTLADDRANDSAAGALGSIPFVDGVPRPTIFMYPKAIDGLVSSATVLGLSDRQVSRGFHDFIVGRVFGRALAHEIGHYLLRSPNHSGKGLMRAVQLIPDLVGQDRQLFALSADQVTRLDSVLAQITPSDNRAEEYRFQIRSDCGGESSSSLSLNRMGGAKAKDTDLAMSSTRTTARKRS